MSGPCSGVGRGLGAPTRSGEQQRTLPCRLARAPTTSKQAALRPRQRRGHWRQQPVKQQRPGRFLRQRPEDRGQVKGDGGAEEARKLLPATRLLATSGPSTCLSSAHKQHKDIRRTDASRNIAVPTSVTFNWPAREAEIISRLRC